MGKPASPSPPDLVEELMDDAVLIARYRRWSGTLTDDLLMAVAKVKALDPASRTLADPSVLELHRLVSDSMRVLPFQALSKLRNGWNPYKVSLWEKMGTGFIVLVAIAIGSLATLWTIHYSTGLALTQELREVSTLEVRKSYSRLIRDMYQAVGQADDALTQLTARREAGARSGEAPADDGGAGPEAGGEAGPFVRPAQFDLARNVYFDSESELALLSQRIAQADARALELIRRNLDYPVPGSRWVLCRYYRWVMEPSEAEIEELRQSNPDRLFYLSQKQQEYCEWPFIPPPRDEPASAPPSPAAPATGGNGEGDQEGTAPVLSRDAAATSLPQPETVALTDSTSYPELGLGLPDGGAAAPSDDTVRFQTFAGYGERLDDMTYRLFDRGILAFTPERFPKVDNTLAQLQRAMAPFAALLLPALYGAMGAAISLLRMAVLPLHPNPSLAGSIQRLIFGGLAAVVLVWFVTPGSFLQADSATLGLSAFGLAFLVGFSLDLFFAVFDRLVALVAAGPSKWERRS